MTQTSFQYGVLQHEITGDLWAIKTQNNGLELCGVRKMRQSDETKNLTRLTLPELTYEVGDDYDYFLRFKEKFAIYPFLKEQ